LNAPLTILVSDHRGAGLAERRLALAAAGFAVELTRDLRASLAACAAARPDLILLDPLTDGAAVELDAIERARALLPALVPVIVLHDDLEQLPATFAERARRGLWDLMRRSASNAELLLRIELLRAQAERLGEVALLRHRATHDDRTDLLRPQVFQERLREHFSAAQRHGLDLALLVLDLDRFGRINKTFDHTVGDALIVEVAGAIRSALRAEDVAGRLGGDEFAVLLPYTKKVDAAQVAQRLREEIHLLTGTVPEAGATEISVSIGFETFNGADVDSVEELRRRAELALREAKRAGGNCGVYFRSLREQGGAQVAQGRP
jgi:diguanylate cyclase (GGDEF)-like protein